MLTAYFDESYNHRTEKNPYDTLIYTAACWLSSEEHWKKFQKKWKAALNSVGVEFFHMKDYESRKGEYEHWSNLKRVGVLKRLHRLMKEHTLYGCSASVSRADYDRIITSELRPYFGKSYYGFNVKACMGQLNEWCNENGHDGPIRYVFAQLTKQGSDLNGIFEQALNDPFLRKALRINSMWEKGDMKVDVPLQSADIIAYEVNKRAVNAASVNLDEQFIRRSLQNLSLDKRFSALYFGREEIERMVFDFKRGQLRTLQTDGHIF